MKRKVLYHKNCNDGSGAALAAWMKFGDMQTEYIPVQYGEEPPGGLDGCDVFILDFSYKRKTVLELADSVARLTIIDHHKSAREDLTPLPQRENLTVIFDMEHSGAALAWRYFHPKITIPLLLRHIEDRDLWRFDLTRTDEVTKALMLYPDWRAWKAFLDKPEIAALYRQGQAIITFLRIQQEKLLASADIVRDSLGTGMAVPTLNLSGFMMSDTLNAALEKFPDCPFAVGYFDLPDRRVYSLRSRTGSTVDVSTIAKERGGGGHMHAAGFTVEMKTNEIQ